MDKAITKFLKDRHSKGYLNFSGLFGIIKYYGIKVYDIGIQGAAGFSDGTCVYLDLQKLVRINDEQCFFIIAHELSHQIRFNRKEPNYTFNIYKNHTFEEYVELGIFEELFADKLACLIYFRLNGTTFDMKRDVETIRRNIESTRPIYNMIKSNNLTYPEIVKYFTYSR